MKIPRLSAHAFKSVWRAMSQKDALAGGALPRELRERIVLHVSAVNKCAVCSSIHEKSALRVGLEETEVARALARDLEGLDEPTRAALRYAELRTLDRLAQGGDEAAGAMAALERFYSPAERTEIDAVVDLFTFYNRANNTWESLLPGATARRRRLGFDE